VPTVEEVENVVGMGHNCWDCIKPEEIIEAVLMLAAAPQPPQESKT
jgi:bacterioferritin-associated ferredoxin